MVELAVKFISVRQEGKFKYGEKEYILEIEKKPGAEIYNFYNSSEGKKGILLCSVYTKYLSKAVGVKKAGEYTREVYGNYEVYLNFVNTLDKIRHTSSKDMQTDRKLIMDDLGGFVDVITRKSESVFHSQSILEGNVLSEKIQELDKETGKEILLLEYNCVLQGKGVKANKVKGIDYVIRESGNSDIKSVQVKTMDMIALEKDLTWVEGKNYRLIKTKEELEDYVERMRKLDKKEVVGFDTETTGLRINRFPIDHPQRDNLVGICLSIEDHEGVYIPIRHKLFENLEENYVIEMLRPLLDSNSEEKVNLVTHYGSFDWKVMWTYGIDLNIVHDTYILQYMINNSTFRSNKKLKDLAYKELGMDMLELDDMFIKTKGRKLDINFAMLPEEPVRHYAPADADATRLLFKKKIPELLPTMRFLYWVEVELMKYLAHMEYYGFRLDLDLLVEMLAEAEKERDKKKQEMFELVGREFNVNSVKDLTQIFYEELKYPVLFFTEKGEPSTGKLALKLLGREKHKDGTPKYPLAGLLQEYKKQEKLINGFIKKMLNENIDGFIFPSYNQTGTDSGRISCSGPNLQQSPGGKSRRVFRSDSDDYYFIIVDYSQIEYRLMAGLAKELDVIEQFKDPEADFHVNMYSRMFGIPAEEVTSAQRKIGKTLNFALTYGMGPFSLALTLYEDTSEEKIEMAKEMADRYWQSVPNIRDMLREAKDRAFLQGYIETKFGRRRYFPDIRSDKNYIREANMRRAANTKVQGTGADILKIAHVKVEREIRKRKLDAMVKLSMHDELVVQVHKDINPWYMLNILRDCMEIKIKGFPPLYIGANVGWTWEAGKRDDLEIPTRLTELMISKGEHLKGGYDDPEKQVEIQIKEYMINRIRQIIQEHNLNTVEKVLNFAKLEKILKDYFGGRDREKLVQDILDNKPIELDEGFVVYNDDDLELFDEFEDDIDGDLDELDEGEGRVIMNNIAVKRMHEDKDRLVLEPPEIPTAEEYYKTDYRVMVHDKKCFIRLDNTTKSVLEELNEYLKTQDRGAGDTVVLEINGKFIETKYKLYRVDKIKLLMILDKHSVA